MNEAALLWATLLQLAPFHIQPSFIITVLHFLPIICCHTVWQHEESLPENLLGPLLIVPHLLLSSLTQPCLWLHYELQDLHPGLLDTITNSNPS